MDRLHLDLSIVKKEHNLDDYGHSNGNILDNIISEDDFHHQFGASHSNSTVPNSEEVDVSVDWLSSFFEEPTTTCYSLSPSLAVTSEAVNAGLKPGALLDDPTCCTVETGFASFPEESSDLARRSDTLRASSYARNPFLSQLEGVTTTNDPEQQINTDSEALKQLNNIKTINRAQLLIKKRQNLSLKKDTFDCPLKATRTNSSAVIARDGAVGLLDADMLSTDIFTIPVKSEAETTDSDSGRNQSRLFSITVSRQQLMRTRADSYDSNSRSPECVSPSSDDPCDVTQRGDFSPAEKDRYHDDNQPHERSPFYLTEEERRTLITEGLPVPKGLPLSKTEERALKKVRRKIKNKISAQESRRKKKEYMESLEKKIDGCNSENLELKKNMEKLENTNRSLLLQLQKLQQFVATRVSRSQATTETQTMECDSVI